MKRTEVKAMLKKAGFTGKVQFRKHNEFGTPDSFVYRVSPMGGFGANYEVVG